MLLFWFVLRAQLVVFLLFSLLAACWGVGYWAFSSSEEIAPVTQKAALVNLQNSYPITPSKFLDLPKSTPVVQLPDLKKYLQFLGKNERPDAAKDSHFFHFSLVGSKEILSIQEGQRGYLSFHRDKASDRFQFSPSNQKTSLYFTCEDAAEGAQIQVSFDSDIGMQVREDDKCKRFVLRKSPHLRPAQGEWSLGGMRVDPSYLAKIKAKWFGKDLFFTDLGGDEYAGYSGKERIIVQDEQGLYSLYAGEGDYFLFKENEWVGRSEVEDSEQFPLLQIKAVDDRLMHCVIWDLLGKRQQPVTLIKHPVIHPVRDVSQEFHFSGAKTKKQFVFDVQEKKMTLTLGDWLLHTPEQGWIKIDSVALLEQYIDGVLAGDLLVLERVEKVEDQKVLLGKIYSSCRTQRQDVHLPVVKEEIVFGSGKPPSGAEKGRPMPLNPINLRAMPQ